MYLLPQCMGVGDRRFLLLFPRRGQLPALPNRLCSLVSYALDACPTSSSYFLQRQSWPHAQHLGPTDHSERPLQPSIDVIPPPEVAAAGHDRCIIQIKPENRRLGSIQTPRTWPVCIESWMTALSPTSSIA